eukprot:88911_1
MMPATKRRKRKRSLTTNTRSRKRRRIQRKRNKNKKYQCNGKTKRNTRCRNMCKLQNNYCYLHQNQDPEHNTEPKYVWIATNEYEASLSTEQKNELCQMIQLYIIHHNMYAHDMQWYHKVYLTGRCGAPEINPFREGMEKQQWNKNLLLSAPKYPKLSSENHIHKYYTDLIDILRYQENVHYDQRFARMNWKYHIYECKRQRDRGIIFKYVYDSEHDGYWNGTRGFLGPWRPYSFIKITLSVLNHEIVPNIVEITSKREIKKIVGPHRISVLSSMIKLSNVLFDIIDEYESIDDFQNAERNEVQNKFISRIDSRHWKCFGCYPNVWSDDLTDYWEKIRKMVKEQAERERNERRLSIFKMCLVQ